MPQFTDFQTGMTTAEKSIATADPSDGGQATDTPTLTDNYAAIAGTSGSQAIYQFFVGDPNDPNDVFNGMIAQIVGTIIDTRITSQLAALQINVAAIMTQLGLTGSTG